MNIRRLALLAAATVLVPVAAIADVRGLVVGVSDGDTLTLLSPENQKLVVRLAGIDSPEKKQAFGARAKMTLADCAYGKTALVIGDKFDRFGRLVGKVVVKGRDCNLNQVEIGMAWHYKKYQGEQSLEDRQLYAVAEERARRVKSGLWSDLNAVAPWEFRKSARRDM